VAKKKRPEKVELAATCHCGESSKVLDRREGAGSIGCGGYSKSYAVPEGVCLRGWYRQQQAVGLDIN
jgi:hypothetical protein